MNFRRLAAVCAAAGTLASGPAWSVGLIETSEDALRSDPALKEAAANRMATLESKPQALAALLPQLEATGGYNKIWSNGTSTFNQVNTNDGSVITVPTSFSRRDDPEKSWRLQLTQTLFRWDQWVTLRQADKELARAEAEYRAAEQDLMARVAQAYFDILGARATLEAAEAAKEAIGRQLEQAQKRFEVGLSAITDVQEAQASYDSAVAGVIEAKRQLAVTRETLRAITGQYYTGLADAGPDVPLITPDPDDVEEWVRTAISNNLSLEASRLGAEIAADNVDLRRAGHYPTIDLVASRSNRDTTADVRNSGVQLPGEPPPPDPQYLPADSDTWQDVVGVQVRVPIYSGGAVASRVKEASHLHRAAQEQLERTARETERQARAAYLSVTSEISRVQALSQSVKSNQTALRATEAGFEVGTRTTVDVLQSRRQLFEAQRDYANSRYTYLVAALLLKQAAGILGEDDMRQVDDWLEPAGQTPPPTQP